MFQILDALKGNCQFCVAMDKKKGEKEQSVFLLKSPGYNGLLCGPHLHVLVGQNGKPKEEVTLFHQ